MTDFDWSTIALSVPSVAIIIFLWKEGVIKFNLKRNGHGNESNNEALKAEVKKEMVYLREHYNDKVTPLLEQIKDELVKVNTQHSEWDKFGIPTRECEKNK